MTKICTKHKNSNVKFTEILSHTFLRKISWKQLIY